MAIEQLFRFVFILYCTTVGVVLLLAPWTPGWDRMVTLVPYSALHLLGLPLLRGALSGFGLVHLVWGLHDLGAFLQPGRDRIPVQGPPIESAIDPPAVDTAKAASKDVASTSPEAPRRQ